MRYLKIDFRQKNGVLSSKCGNNRVVTYDVIFVYAHDKINILFLFWALFLSLVYDFILNTQGFI